MADTTSLTSFLDDVASAIKYKKGDNTAIPAANFDTEIRNLPSQGTYEEKSVTITQNGTQNVVPDSGYDALSRVSITTAVPEKQLQTKSSTITDNGTIELHPDTGYDGFDQVNLTINVSGGGDIPVKLFSSVTEMNASTGNEDGDLALVYGGEYIGIDERSVPLTTLAFPATVTRSSALSPSVTKSIYAGNGNVCNLVVDLTKTSCRIYNQNSMQDYARYTSSDGLAYTLIYSRDTTLSPTVTQFYSGYTSNRECFDFLYVGGMRLEGLYEYDFNDSSWEQVSTGLSASTDYVYSGKEFIGINSAVSVGTLGSVANNTFSDISAEVYWTIQKLYDNMTPRVLTNSDKTVSGTIFVIPTKSDGTPLLDTSAVTNMSSWLYQRQALLSIPQLDTSNVTTMNNMCRENVSLVSVDLPDTNKVTDFASAFYGCSKLKKVLLPKTDAATTMQSAFNNCTLLEEIVLGNTSHVTNFNGTFSRCDSLTTIPSLDIRAATDVSRMFSSCDSLTTIPDFDLSVASNIKASNMFSDCTSLTNVTLTKTNNITNMLSMFYNCTELETATLTHLNSCTSIYSMFNGCTSLTTVTLQNTSSLTETAYAFNGCTSLTTVSQFDTSRVTNMQCMFKNCSSLVTTPILNLSSVTGLNEMFSGCTSLETIDLSGGTINSSISYHTNVFSGVPTNCVIYVKDQTSKTTLEGWDNTHTYTIKTN